jgi:hypothetical protein
MTTKKRAGLNTSRRLAIPAKPNELQIDLDNAESIRRHGHYYVMLEREGLTHGWVATYTASKTLNHLHCSIELPKPLPVETRVLLQALLGSHITRELYNYVRVTRKAPMPIIFFKDGTANV